MVRPIIEVADLSVEYATTRAVDGICFEVDQGEVFGLLGTNGAGKTTTMDVLEGYRKPTSGTVRVLGRRDPYTQRDDNTGGAPRRGVRNDLAEQHRLISQRLEI